MMRGGAALDAAELPKQLEKNGRFHTSTLLISKGTRVQFRLTSAFLRIGRLPEKGRVHAGRGTVHQC